MSRMLSSCVASIILVLPACATYAQDISAGNIRRIHVQSQPEAHPQAKACFTEPGVKLLGGGAQVETVEPGNLLTASFPEGNCWVAQSKDHKFSSPARITAFAIGLFDPAGQFEVRTVSKTSRQEAHPTMVVDLPAGFTLTGGGARTNFSGAGSLLTASFPQTPTRWEARAKDHQISDPASVTAFIIGIRRVNGLAVTGHMESAESIPDAHPQTEVRLPGDFILTGGGARANWADPQPGSLLTASFPISGSPDPDAPAVGWRVRSKDHAVASPVRITAWAIGIK